MEESGEGSDDVHLTKILKFIDNHNVLFLLLILFFLVILYTQQLPSLSRIDDVGVPLALADVINEGKIPYVDFILPHEPLSYFIYALVFKTFGRFLLTAQLFTVLITLLTIFFVYLIGKRFYSPKIGLLSAFLFGLNPVIFKHGWQTLPYIFAICFLVISLFFFFNAYFTKKNRFYIAAGLFIALAVLCKYYALFSLIAYVFFFAYLCLTQHLKIKYALRNALCLLVGFLMPFIIFITYLVHHNTLYQWFEQSFLQNVNFLQNAKIGFFPERVLYEIYRLVKDNLLVSLFGAAIVFTAFIKKRTKELILIFQGACFLFFFLVSRMIFTVHYYLFYAPVVLLGSFSFISFLQREKRLPVRIFLILFLLFTIFLYLETNIMESHNTYEIQNMFTDQTDYQSITNFITMIQKHSNANEYIFADYPFINFIADRKAPPNLILLGIQTIKPCIIDAPLVIAELEKYSVSMVIIHVDNKGKRLRASSIPHQIVEMCHYSDFKEYLTGNYLFLKQQNINDMVFDVYIKKTTPYNQFNSKNNII